jgi:hypothetical protein
MIMNCRVIVNGFSSKSPTKRVCTEPTDFATYIGVAHLDALFAILEPWSVLRPWDFAWAFLLSTDVRQQSECRTVRPSRC